MAAADRSLMAEISFRNGLRVCATLFDLHQFFETVEPISMLEAIRQTEFPPIDAVMGLQVHYAPRIIQVATISSDFI